MRTPVVSVVMPFRNAEATLTTAIASLAAQSFRDFEVIAVDDGSTDAGVTHLERERLAITVLRHDQSMGVGASLNCGIQQARGKYIARMDADDIARPNRLATQVRALESIDVDIVGSRVSFFGERQAYRWNLMEKLKAETSDDIRLALLMSNQINHPTVMTSRRFFADWEYRTDIGYEDYDLWLRARACKFKNLDQRLLRYRLGGNSSLVDRTEKFRAVIPALAAAWDSAGYAVPSDDAFLAMQFPNHAFPGEAVDEASRSLELLARRLDGRVKLQAILRLRSLRRKGHE